jgi:hypothetical protein
VKRLFILVMVILSLFTGCFSGGEENSKTPEVVVKPKIDVTGSVYGKVIDEKGSVLSDVTVSIGESIFTTDSNGFYVLNNVKSVNGKMVVKFKKDGYFDITRAESVSENINQYELNSKLVSKTGTNAKLGVISAVSGGSLESSNSSKVEIPANGVVDKDGKDYSGIINISMIYLDPTKSEFGEIIPGGEMDAVRTDGSETMLISYGVIGVELKDEYGNKIQIKKGAKSKITVAVAESQRESAPAEIPLWYFEDAKGIWIEDGKAVLSADKTKYEGEVTHFTYWNCDIPSDDQARISGYVKDKDGNPLMNVVVKLGQVYAYTDRKGYYTRRVPSGVEIETAATLILNGGVSTEEGPKVVLRAGEEKKIDFNLKTFKKTVVYGEVRDSAGVIEGAVITAGVDYSITDSDGKYEIMVIPGKEQEINLNYVYGKRIEVFSEKVTVSEGDRKEVNITIGTNGYKYLKIKTVYPDKEKASGNMQIRGEFIDTNIYLYEEGTGEIQIPSDEKKVKYSFWDSDRNWVSGDIDLSMLRVNQTKEVTITVPLNGKEEYFELTVDGKLRDDIGKSRYAEVHIYSYEDVENSSLSIGSGSGSQYGSNISFQIYNDGKTGAFILDKNNTNGYISVEINDKGENGYPESYYIEEKDSVKISIQKIGKIGEFIEGTLEGTLSNREKEIKISGKFKIRRVSEYQVLQ